MGGTVAHNSGERHFGNRGLCASCGDKGGILGPSRTLRTEHEKNWRTLGDSNFWYAPIAPGRMVAWQRL